MRQWKFSKPKTPGFGINKSFYLSLLSSSPTLPVISHVINPKGEHGAVEGFGAPLRADATKDAIHQPFQHGTYAIASKDQKTVLKLMVMEPRQAGFDTEAFAQSLLAMDYGPDVVGRIRNAWFLAQLTFESHDPMVYPSLDFLLDFVGRFSGMSDGVVADPISRRYLLPGQVRVTPRADPKVDAREHVSVQFRLLSTGLHAYTLGLQKFALPEFEITGLEDRDQAAVTTYLMALCQTVLVTGPAKLGWAYGPFQVSDGGFDTNHWRGIPVYELLPDRAKLPTEALGTWNG